MVGKNKEIAEKGIKVERESKSVYEEMKDVGRKIG